MNWMVRILILFLLLASIRLGLDISEVIVKLYHYNTAPYGQKYQAQERR